MAKIIVAGDFCLGGVAFGGHVWWATDRDVAMAFDDTADAVDFHRHHCRRTNVTIEDAEPCRARAAES